MNKVLLLILLISNVSYAANFTATVSKNPVTQGENFQLTFTVDEQASNFQAPSFSAFNVLSGPSTSQQTSIVNGKMSYSLSYTYVLSAKKKGSYFIAPAKIDAGGKTLSSNRIKVLVVEPSEAEKQRRANQKQKEQQQAQQAKDLINKNFYVKLRVDKSSVYQGEQLTATYVLYVHQDLDAKLKDYELPVFNGFWTQDIDVDNIQWKREIVNGVPFRSKVFKKVILYPQYSGKIKIEPLKLDVAVNLQIAGGGRRRSMFDDIWNRGNYKTFEETVTSNSVNVNVKELPDPQPLDFTGAVGNLEVQTWIDKTETSTNDPITLKVKISGNGNLKLLDPLELEFPPDFEVYEPKLVDNSRVTGNGTSGNIIFEYLVIPRNPGEYKIDPITVSWFDIEKKQYKQHLGEEYIISVSKGKDGVASNMVTGISKENVQYIGKDIRFIKTESELNKKSKPIFGTFTYYSFMSLPAAAFIIAFFYRRKRDEDQGDLDLQKNRQANKVAKKRLSSAAKEIGINSEAFYEELSKALWGYLSDKLSINISDLTKDSAKKELLNRNIPENEIDEYLDLINTCEMARYAPISSDNPEQDLYDSSSMVIKSMEEKLR